MEPWLLYMLRGVEETAIETLRLVEGICTLMADIKKRLREEHPKLYSQDLLNNLLWHPYTRIEFIQQELNVSRPTATKYFDELAESGLLLKHRCQRAPNFPQMWAPKIP